MSMDGGELERLARIEANLENLTVAVADLRASLSSSVVTKAEWQLRNQYVDAQLAANAADIAELKQGRGPWWVWAMALVALVSLVWNFAQPVVQAILTR